MLASSTSEFSEESGGDNTAPVGILRLFTGGGDCRTLALGAKSVASTPISVSVGVGGAPSDFAIDGDLRCLWMYEDEDKDRGGAGRLIAGDRGPSS